VFECNSSMKILGFVLFVCMMTVWIISSCQLLSVECILTCICFVHLSLFRFSFVLSLYLLCLLSSWRINVSVMLPAERIKLRRLRLMESIM